MLFGGSRRRRDGAGAATGNRRRDDQCGHVLWLISFERNQDREKKPNRGGYQNDGDPLGPSWHRWMLGARPRGAERVEVPKGPEDNQWRRRESNPRRESVADTAQTGPDPSSPRARDLDQNERHDLTPIHPDQLSLIDELGVGDGHPT